MVNHGITAAAMGGMPMIVITGAATLVVDTKAVGIRAVMVALAMAVATMVVVMPVVVMAMAAVRKVAVVMATAAMATVFRHGEMNKDTVGLIVDRSLHNRNRGTRAGGSPLFAAIQTSKAIL